MLRDGTLISYNLRVLIGVLQGKYTRESFEGSMERLAPKDQSVYLFSAGIMSDRSLGEYAGVLFLVRGNSFTGRIA